MAYKLLEFGGKANVILRANIEMSINDNHYLPGDVVFLFEEVDLDFQYNEKNSESTVGKKNQLSHFERNINTISISGLSLTTDYIEVFGQKQTNTFERSVIVEVEVTNNTWYSLHNLSREQVFIIGQGMYNVTIDPDYNEIIIDGQIDDGKYTVIYYTSVSNPTYNINNMESIPYMTMEITGLGNVDKENGNIYIKIPKVNLINRPDFSLSDRITAQDLVFKVIQDTILMGVY